jgi:hypothetical protein
MRARSTVKTLRQSNNPPTENEERVKNMLVIFLHIKGIVHKEFVLAGKTVNSTYYCDLSQ